MKIKKKITYWFSVIAIGIALGLVLQFVRAWTEPGAPPPSGNLGAPINTSAIEQTKYGPLNIYGSDHGIWTTGSNYGIVGNDSDNSTWGVLGYGGWGGAFGGPVNSNSFMQAVAFLDDDPNYYLDLNTYSNINKLNISRTGLSECCSGGDYTLSLSENTNGTGKRAGIQFHNSGEAEGQFRLNNGPNGREFLAYGNQTDMDLRSSGVVRGDQGLCIGGDCRSSWPSMSVSGAPDMTNCTVRQTSAYTQHSCGGSSEVMCNSDEVAISGGMHSGGNAALQNSVPIMSGSKPVGWQISMYNVCGGGTNCSCYMTGYASALCCKLK